jgi:capsular polysaccharide biosynthesis protein
MTLKDAFRIILNKIWLVVAIPFVAVVVATILVTFVIEPQYTASTTMYVLNKQNADNNVINYADLQSSQLLTADYRELALSARVLSAVADQLGLNAEDLQKKYDITVTAANNTRVIQISATSEDAVLAANLANTIGQEFAVSVMEIMDVNNVSVVDVAVPPTEPSAPRKLMAIAGAGVGGLAVAVALVLVMEMFNTTIRTREDVERALGLTVLASIPKVEVKA